MPMKLRVLPIGSVELFIVSRVILLVGTKLSRDLLLILLGCLKLLLLLLSLRRPALVNS